jgi:hypothetical protein
MSKLNGSEAASACFGYCGCFVMILILNVTIGGLCFAYSLFSILGKEIPWYADAICGLFLGQFAIPCALVCWILRLCGVEAPFIPSH